MKNRLRIGDAIYTILKDFKNVYPVKADEGTTFPFMIYRRVSGQSQSSKDGIYSSIAHIEVNIVAQSNEESIELAEKVLQKLEAARGPVEVCGEMDLLSRTESLACGTHPLSRPTPVSPLFRG